jgi:hypothetical protein
LTSFKNISELQFESGYLPTDEDIDYLTGSDIEGLKAIRLNCEKVTDRGIISIARRGPSLQSVNLLNIRHLTDFSINIVTKKNLKEFTLADLTSSYVTEKQLNPMIENLIDIEYLNLMDNTPVVTDDILEIIAQKCKKLKSLCLWRNEEITTSGLNTLLSNSGHQMISLDVSYCNIVKN